MNKFRMLSYIQCVQDPTAVLSEQRSVQNERDFTAVDVSCNFYDYTLVTNNNL